MGQEDPLEEGMGTHSSIIAWRILWTGAWGATVHRATQSWRRLKRLSREACTLGQEEPVGKGMANHSRVLNLENSMDRGARWIHGVT